MISNFTKPVPKKSYEHLVEEIQDAICEGEFQEGERLPPELKLAELFQTSRGTVREALRVLEQKGLVKIRPGAKGGAVVQEASTHAVSDGIGLLIRQKQVSLEGLCEFRELLEGHVAAQVAATAQGETLRELEEIMDKVTQLVRGGIENWEAFNEWDAKFHRALARAGGNVLIQANLDTLHQNIHTYFTAFLKPCRIEYLDENLETLREIYEAVRKKEPERARNAAIDHVRLFTHHMEAHP